MIRNILIGAVLVLGMITSAGATEVRLDPASQTVAAGDTFDVNITMNNVTNMKGDAATLNFDPDAMQVTGIIEGDFLKTGGSTLPAYTWDNAAGTATFGYSLSGASTVTGSGTLATIRFDTYPDAPADTYDLHLTDVELRDASNTLIMPISVVDGTVTLLNTSVPVPLLSGTGMIVLVGMLAVVLAISVTRRK